MRIHDVHDFDAKQAGIELLEMGFTTVDDVSGELIKCAEAELLDALGFAADDLDLGVDEIHTSFGPVFVFWDRGRATLDAAKAFVSKNRSGS